MAFDDRIGASGLFEELVQDYLDKIGVKNVTPYGSEHTHLEFANKIRTQTDPVSKQVRFKPDGIGVDDLGSFYFEAKTTMEPRPQTIECDAYENYMSLHRQGGRLKLFIRPYYNAKDPKPVTVYWNYIEEVRFIPSEDVVGRFPPEKRFPIVNGWISPRAAGKRTGSGSDTPYKEIDLKSMIKIPDFYDDEPGPLPTCNPEPPPTKPTKPPKRADAPLPLFDFDDPILRAIDR